MTRIRIDIQTANSTYVGYRCLHIAEGGHPSALDRPEVRPSLNGQSIPFTRELQLLSWELNTYNPLFTKNKWRVVYSWDRAFTDFNGFDRVDRDGNPTDPRADFVNMQDLTAPLPKLMKAIICGGMFIRGEVSNGYLWCTPGVHGIDASKPIPTAAEVMERGWYFAATQADEDSASHFPQGGGRAVYIPFVLRDVTGYPAEWFTRWSAETLPDPLRIYMPA